MVWYAISRTFGDLVLTFLLINRRDLFPFAATLVTCVFQLMLLEISTQDPSTGDWSWSIYSVLKRALEAVTCVTGTWRG